MASKKYAYYNKGNKIAVVEQSPSTSSGRLAVAHCTISGHTTKDTCEAAGGQWIPGSSGSLESYGRYISPTESVNNALEIEYAYTQIYNTYDTPVVDVNKLYINGWTVVGGYLTFFRNELYQEFNWTIAPGNAVTSGSSGDVGGTSGHDYILVGGSSRWNGIHRVKTAQDDGLLITYTKADSTLPYWEDQDIDFTSAEVMRDGDGASNIYLADYFSTGDYLFISGVSGTTQNNGLFRVASVSKSVTDTTSTITIDKQYAVSVSDVSDSYATGLDNEFIADAAFGNQAGISTVNVYKAHRDFAYILTNVTVLNNEDFELDITRKQALALVYYLKARNAEDMNDLKAREYFMKLFHKQIEEAASSRKYGPRIIQGFSEMIR